MQNQEVYDELVAKFEAKYGQKPQIVAYAPGRIDLHLRPRQGDDLAELRERHLQLAL